MFTMSHDRTLDKVNIQCRFKNITLARLNDKNLKLSHYETRLFFNKRLFPLGQLFFRVGDEIELKFTAIDASDTEKKEDDMKAFSIYRFRVDG